MKLFQRFLLGFLTAATLQSAFAQGMKLTLPRLVQAGMPFSVKYTGSGEGTLYILGPGQALKRQLQPGDTTTFPAGSITNAGQYLVLLQSSSSTDTGILNIVPATRAASLSFFDKPSRLPVDLRDAITGTVYVFDAYHNLILAPSTVSFELNGTNGQTQKHVVVTHDGAAWTTMDSTAEQGADRFWARTGDIATLRIVSQVPGDPCGLKMNAQPSGQSIQLQTEPVLDCKGNAIPDGTIVTFSESHLGMLSTVDVPLKRGIAEVLMPAENGATISVASGVVLGNQILWRK